MVRAWGSATPQEFDAKEALDALVNVAQDIVQAPPSAPDETSPPTSSRSPVDPLELFPEQDNVDLDLPATQLGEALRLLAQAGAVNLVLAEDFPEPVQMSLNGITLREAVRALAHRFDLALEQQGNVLLVSRALGPQIQGKMFATYSVSAQEIADAVKELLSQNGQLTVSPSDNAIFVRDTGDHLRQVEEFLAVVDTREQQVAIEVRILEVGYSDGFELGFLFDVDVSLDDTAGNILQSLLTAQTSFVTTLSDNGNTFRAVLDALKSISTLDLLSAPRVTALSGREAFIEIVTRIPYIQATNSISSDGGASVASAEQVVFEEVGISLKVTPVVQNDGYIRLSVEPTVSEAVDFFEGVPVVDRRKVTTEVIVGNADTIFLGGLFRDNFIQTIDKIPLLGDIPYLGALFRRRVDRHVKTQLIILITPRIVDAETAVAIQRKNLNEQRHLRSEVEYKTQ